MTLKWNIANLNRKPDTGLVFEVSFFIEFDYLGKQDIYIGIVELEGDESSDSFIPYTDLQEETVIEWVQSKLGNLELEKIKEDIKVKIEKAIAEEESPRFISGIPW